MTETKKEPLYVRQYHEAKEKNTGILIFRLGESYAAFADDAKTLSEVLGLQMRHWYGDFPVCDFHEKFLDRYVNRLLAQNFCVSVLEQVE